MGVKRKKYCTTCRHENVDNRKLDNTGGVSIWCNYKDKYINNTERLSVWCPNWEVHKNFKYEEFEDSLAPQTSSNVSSPNTSSSYKPSYFYWGYDASTRFKRTFKFIFLGIAGIILGGMMDSTEIAAGSLIIFGGLATLNFVGSIYAFIMGE